MPARSRPLFFCLMLAGMAFLNGCQSIGYYHQAVSGHISLMMQREAITDLLDSPTTPQPLKTQFEKLLQLREFAKTDLELPVSKNYTSYSDLKRPYAVWNVFAAPELSLQPKAWCYPMIGCANYRGYYDLADAQSYAQRLKRQGYDVYIAGAAAYSTLGWFSDPVLNTFIYRSDPELASLLFHELAHQVFYVAGDTAFNESFATVVAQEGVRRWLKHRQDDSSWQAYLQSQQRQQDFLELVNRYRLQLAELYESNAKVARKREQKAIIIKQLKTAYLTLQRSWQGSKDYQAWFKHDINNAQLLSVATYFDHVPQLRALFANSHQDLPTFYRRSQALSKLSQAERQLELASLTNSLTMPPKEFIK